MKKSRIIAGTGKQSFELINTITGFTYTFNNVVGVIRDLDQHNPITIQVTSNNNSRLYFGDYYELKM